MFQFVAHEAGRVKQLEANIAVVGPALQEHEHADDAVADNLEFGEIDDDDAGMGLRRDRVAQLECRVAADESAFALNHGHISYVVNVYV
jgi:hypothetical protein